MLVRSMIMMALACLSLAAPSMGAGSDEDCSGYPWDVRREHALFGTVPTPLAAATSAATLPVLAADRLYALRLSPAAGVTFAAPPAKAIPAEGRYAGLVAIALEAPGAYRIAVDLPVWMDVAADGKLVPVLGYQGLASCASPRKLVEFDLSGGQRFVLQVSGASGAVLRVLITGLPAAHEDPSNNSNVR